MPYSELGGLYQTENWNELHNIMIDAMIRLDRTFRKRIRAITI